MDAVINPAGVAGPVAANTAYTRRSILLPELSRLIGVQEIDREIQAVEREIDQLPTDLKATEAALAQLQEELTAHLQKLEDLKAQRRDTEAEMAGMEHGLNKSRPRP